jgi:AcrR family transcriptional regulator
MTAKRVIDEAVALTQESHLMSWSIRDLAARLGVAPSVVYHHVGGKDLLSRRVVERMLSRVEVPSRALSWRDWFTELLISAGPIAAAYPGCAKWLLMHGPTIPAVLPVLDAGTSILHEAGFGEHAEFAYALLLNNAMLTVSISDDRRQHEGDGPRDHATMMAEFARMSSDSPSVRAMGQEFIRPFAAGGDEAERMRWAYYRFMVETTIAGLEARLPATGRRDNGGAVSTSPAAT